MSEPRRLFGSLETELTILAARGSEAGSRAFRRYRNRYGLRSCLPTNGVAPAMPPNDYQVIADMLGEEGHPLATLLWHSKPRMTFPCWRNRPLREVPRWAFASPLGWGKPHCWGPPNANGRRNTVCDLDAHQRPVVNAVNDGRFRLDYYLAPQLFPDGVCPGCLASLPEGKGDVRDSVEFDEDAVTNLVWPEAIPFPEIDYSLIRSGLCSWYPEYRLPDAYESFPTFRELDYDYLSLTSHGVPGLPQETLENLIFPVARMLLRLFMLDHADLLESPNLTLDNLSDEYWTAPAERSPPELQAVA